MTEAIKLNNREFPLREVEFDFGKRLISTETLNEQITDAQGRYTSEEARVIDESIFYYVDHHSIQLAEDSLCAKILSEI